MQAMDKYGISFNMLARQNYSLSKSLKYRRCRIFFWKIIDAGFFDEFSNSISLQKLATIRTIPRVFTGFKLKYKTIAIW